MTGSRTLNRGNRRWITAAILLIVLAGVFYFVKRHRHEAKPESLGSVRRGPLEQTVNISGSIAAKRSLILNPSYTGYVRKLFVKVGDVVKAGDPIVLISTTLRGDNDESLPMRSPFNGTVVQILKQEGESIDKADTTAKGAVRIDDLSSYYLIGSATERDIWPLKAGQKAIVRVSSLSGKTFPAKIESVSIASNAASNSMPGGSDSTRVDFPIRIRLDGGTEILRPGLAASASIVAYRAEDVLFTELEYLQSDAKGWFVTTVDGSVKRVEIGKRNNDVVEIISGAVEGDRLTLSGSNRNK